MSNGGFDDIHRKLLSALERAGPERECHSFRILPAGDAALVVELPRAHRPRAERLVRRPGGRARRPASAPIVRDVVIGYCSVTVYFDPLHRRRGVARGRGARARRAPRRRRPPPRGRSWKCRSATAAIWDLTSRDVGGVRGLLRGRRDRRCTPAASIASTWSASFQASPTWPRSNRGSPRRGDRTPRTAVPAGSVAIAGGQTGIYPAVTPGGWNIIGRTPVRPYDPDRAEPFLFKSGDRVRFRAVSPCTSSSSRDASPHRHSPRDVDDGSGPRPLGIAVERRAGGRADG